MSHHFCPMHAEQMKTNESQALRSWCEMMRRGMDAYMQCRVDAAYIYLESALDITLLRAGCEQNGIFDMTHLTKPAEFIIQLMLVDTKFNEAVYLLSRLSNLGESLRVHDQAAFTEFLSSHYTRIEVAEKAHMANLSNDDLPRYATC